MIAITQMISTSDKPFLDSVFLIIFFIFLSSCCGLFLVFLFSVCFVSVSLFDGFIMSGGKGPNNH